LFVSNTFVNNAMKKDAVMIEKINGYKKLKRRSV